MVKKHYLLLLSFISYFHNRRNRTKVYRFVSKYSLGLSRTLTPKKATIPHPTINYSTPAILTQFVLTVVAGLIQVPNMTVNFWHWLAVHVSFYVISK
jgi:hypothetical protein